MENVPGLPKRFSWYMEPENIRKYKFHRSMVIALCFMDSNLASVL